MPKSKHKLKKTSENIQKESKTILFKKKANWLKFDKEKQKILESIKLSTKVKLSTSNEEDDVDIISVDNSENSNTNLLAEACGDEQ